VTNSSHVSPVGPQKTASLEAPPTNLVLHAQRLLFVTNCCRYYFAFTRRVYGDRIGPSLLAQRCDTSSQFLIIIPWRDCFLISICDLFSGQCIPFCLVHRRRPPIDGCMHAHASSRAANRRIPTSSPKRSPKLQLS